MQGPYASAIATVTVAVAVGGLILLAVGLPPRGRSPPQEYRLSRAKWESSGIHSYELTVQDYCECDMRPIRVTVVNDRVARALFANVTAAKVPTEADLKYRLLTVDAIFDDIARSYSKAYFKVSAVYDGKYGYPVEYSRDPDAKVIDDDSVTKISDFSPGPRG